MTDNSGAEYLSGGYYVVKAVARPADLSNLLPEQLLTMSSCFTGIVSDIVRLQWDDYANVREAIADEAREFGIPKVKIPDLITWAKAQHNTNYLVYSEVQPAMELRRRFVGDASTHVLGIGLHESLHNSFESQLGKDANRGFSLLELVNEKRPPAAGGRALGFEPLGFYGTSFHSWLCHYAPDKVHKRFGICPNDLGLIDTLDEARKVTDFLVETGAEPAIWEPWLLLDYTPTDGPK